MACMFNRNLFICLNRRGGGNKREAERKKDNNIKMDGLLVMQMKDNIIQSRNRRINNSSSI